MCLSHSRGNFPIEAKSLLIAWCVCRRSEENILGEGGERERETETETETEHDQRCVAVCSGPWGFAHQIRGRERETDQGDGIGKVFFVRLIV